MPAQHFTPKLFAFLRELAAHNDRDWFAANKERYERDVRTPALRFINDFAAPLAKLAPHLVAAKAAKAAASVPGFYLHLQPGESFAAARPPRGDRDVCKPGFIGDFAKSCRTMAPLVRFVSRSLDLPW